MRFGDLEETIGHLLDPKLIGDKYLRHDLDEYASFSASSYLRPSVLERLKRRERDELAAEMPCYILPVLYMPQSTLAPKIALSVPKPNTVSKADDYTSDKTFTFSEQTPATPPSNLLDKGFTSPESRYLNAKYKIAEKLYESNKFNHHVRTSFKSFTNIARTSKNNKRVRYADDFADDIISQRYSATSLSDANDTVGNFGYDFGNTTTVYDYGYKGPFYKPPYYCNDCQEFFNDITEPDTDYYDQHSSEQDLSHSIPVEIKPSDEDILGDKVVVLKDEVVQVSPHKAQIETMTTRSLNEAASVQTFSDFKLQATKSAQTNMKNIEKALLLLPEEKVHRSLYMQQRKVNIEEREKAAARELKRADETLKTHNGKNIIFESKVQRTEAANVSYKLYCLLY